MYGHPQWTVGTVVIKNVLQQLILMVLRKLLQQSRINNNLNR